MRNLSPSRMFLAIAMIGLPAVALAQSVVVPPPTPLSAQAAAVPAAPAVMPATTVASVNPAAAAPAQLAPTTAPAGLVDIAIPQAPKPEPVSLKPSAPAAAKRAVQKPAAAHAKKAVDPYAGLAGTPVSDAEFNRFVYPEPVEGVYFPEGAPLPECPDNAAEQDPCKPLFLNGRRMMLLQLRAGAKGPVQMLTHLQSGRMVTMHLMPVPGPGAVVRVDGAEDGASDARLAAASTSEPNTSGMTATEEDVAMLSRFARGDIPAGFEPEAVAKPLRYEYFDVIPLATWSNGSTQRVHLMQVKAFGKTPVAINAGLFRNENVRAVALDRETITEDAPAQLYLLERVPTEQQ